GAVGSGEVTNAIDDAPGADIRAIAAQVEPTEPQMIAVVESRGRQRASLESEQKGVVVHWRQATRHNSGRHGFRLGRTAVVARPRSRRRPLLGAIEHRGPRGSGGFFEGALHSRVPARLR